ncbi:phage major capsid protein [Microvirga tunisiensis]|uniref:Phage major capsid protein n=1 Tax=Pannonibacter tanglangensis TaxID=2750084 RepID=A0A7X5F4M4_9HYPH|nr:phage major capsid protein [Pannonibacter sp. XCT-53]NBN78685.1 phage major capsid protein [Pannonibacter sp. XCT-53]
MSKIKELREKQARLVAEARSRLDEITDQTTEERAKELEAQHDAAMQEHDRLEQLIEREERLAKVEERHREHRQRERPVSGGSGGGVDEPGAEVSYRHAFARMICGAEVQHMSDEERAVLRAHTASFETRQQLASVAAAGGYTVPTELLNEIIKTLKAWGPMYDDGLCTVMQTSSGNPQTLPTVDDTDKSADEHAEGSALADDNSGDVVFGQRALSAYSFDTPFIKWSWELDQDSIFSMEALLGELLGERLGRLANRRLTTGTGTNAPQGIVTGSSLGVTGATVSGISFDNVMELEHSVNRAYRRSPKCTYMFNDKTFLAVRKLKDGEGNYLWQKGDVTRGAPDLFNNYRYAINDDMDDLGPNRIPMIFGDFAKYYVRKVGQPIIGVLRERFWPAVGIAGLIRFDGRVADPSAIKHFRNAAS